MKTAHHSQLVCSKDIQIPIITVLELSMKEREPQTMVPFYDSTEKGEQGAKHFYRSSPTPGFAEYCNIYGCTVIIYSSTNPLLLLIKGYEKC
jgi:hypothetical protein